MKTYIKATLVLLVSGMLFSSCEDQLNQANPNKATEDTFWKNETDFNLALTSCYTPLKNALGMKLAGRRVPASQCCPDQRLLTHRGAFYTSLYGRLCLLD